MTHPRRSKYDYSRHLLKRICGLELHGLGDVRHGEICREMNASIPFVLPSTRRVISWAKAVSMGRALLVHIPFVPSFLIYSSGMRLVNPPTPPLSPTPTNSHVSKLLALTVKWILLTWRALYLCKSLSFVFLFENLLTLFHPIASSTLPTGVGSVKGWKAKSSRNRQATRHNLLLVDLPIQLKTRVRYLRRTEEVLVMDLRRRRRRKTKGRERRPLVK